MNGIKYCLTRFSHTQVLDSSYHEFRIMSIQCYISYVVCHKSFALMLAWT
jgi:hypothetical protein